MNLREAMLNCACPSRSLCEEARECLTASRTGHPYKTVERRDEPGDGGSAFPTDAATVHPADMNALRACMNWSATQARSVLGRSPGMTLRDYFAGQALAGMLAADDASFERAAALAYGYADALLKQRAKPQEGS